MRVIGLDVHRTFAVVAVLENGQLRIRRRVELTREAVLAFGRTLRPDDEVVIEATGNTGHDRASPAPLRWRVVIANPLQVRAIAQAKVKTDKIDAARLGQAACQRLSARGLDAGRGDRDAAAAGRSAHPGRAADDPGEEPDPQHPPCQPDPTLPRPVVRRRGPGLVGGPALGAG